MADFLATHTCACHTVSRRYAGQCTRAQRCASCGACPNLRHAPRCPKHPDARPVQADQVEEVGRDA